MAKETKEKMEKKQVDAQEKATDNMLAYFRLGTILFGQEDPPYNINELKEDSEFIQPAKDLAKELGIDWEKMTHEESNRIMLSLLDDYFNAINVDGDFSFTLTVKTTPKQKK